MHLRSLERFDFDSLLLPYNPTMMQNPQYAADFETLIKICEEKKVAVQTIKTLSRGPWGDKEKVHNTWYEPFSDQADIDKVVHWALSRPGIFLNTAADIHLLPKVLDAIARYETPVTDEEVAQLAMEPLFVE